jgi:hypothetical protein
MPDDIDLILYDGSLLCTIDMNGNDLPMINWEEAAYTVRISFVIVDENNRKLGQEKKNG